MAVLWTDFCGNHSPYDQFWDSSLTIDTALPRLTDCFEDTVLTWIPCLALWIALPWYLPYLFGRTSRRGPTESSYLNIAKLVFSTILAVFGIVDLVLPLVQEDDVIPTSTSKYVGFAIFTVTMIIITIIMALEYQKEMHTSKVCLFFWLGIGVSFIFILSSDINRAKLQEEAWPRRFVLTLFTALFILVELVLQCFADTQAARKHRSSEYVPLLGVTSIKQEETIPVDTDMEHPETYIPYVQYVLRTWCFSVLYKSYTKGTITFHDIYNLPRYLTSSYIVPLFEKVWNKTLAKSSRNMLTGHSKRKHTSLFMLLLWHRAGQFIANMVFLLVFKAANFGLLFLLPVMIVYMDSPNTYLWQGLFLTFLFFIILTLRVIIFNSFIQHTVLKTGITLRTILLSAIFKKATRLSNDARKSTTVGEIMNLMSVDAYKFLYFPMYFDLFWETPFLIIISTGVLYYIIGPACFAGILFLSIVVPLNMVIVGKIQHKHQKKQIDFKDRRIKLLNEIITGIKVLKLYAWEIPFEARLNDYRQTEMKELRKANLAQGIGIAVWFLIPWLTQQVIVGTYVLISPENVLDAQTAFMTLTLTGILAFPIQFLPFTLSHGVQAITAADRIEKFLLLSEEDPEAIGNNPGQDCAVRLENCTFSWGSIEDPVLRNLHISIKKGELVAVVGRVGCGKSSLLASMIGELTKLSGSVDVQGSVGYVPQQPWIQNATLKDNILFGKPFSRSSYMTVVDACSLAPDFQVLPSGDMTEIGEKGINLSGGQRQRVSLARAVYQEKEVYLLDDTLSAVDIHVGHHIFERVLGPQGLLAGKTRIVVTHGLNFLPRYDQVILLTDGRITDSGKFEELIATNAEFAELMKTYVAEISSEEETDSEALEILQKHFDISLPSSEISSDENSGRIRAKKRQKEKIETDDKLVQNKLIEDESQQTGNVSFKVVYKFLQSAGFCTLLLLVLCFLLLVVCNTAMNIWLSEWTGDVKNNATSRDVVMYRLAVYASIGGAEVVMAVLLAVVAATIAVAASKQVHNNALYRVLRSPMRFFETTPTGRILNRLSSDIDTLDTIFPPPLMSYIFGIVLLATTFLVITYSTPLFLLAGVPIFGGLIFIQTFFRNSLRQSKRLEATAMSPLYSHLEESLTGSSVIKAFNRRESTVAKSCMLLDKSHKAFYQFFSLQQCVTMYYTIVGSLVVVFASLFLVIDKDNLSGSQAGLSLSFSINAISTLTNILSLEILVETGFISLERIDEYTDIELEASWDHGAKKPSINWPQEGLIELQNYSTRYRPGLDLVIRGMSCRLNPGEKIGIVGRTGAGKSSLTLSLFRLIEPAVGRIVIDGVDISEIGLHQLRDKITIIPQDPVLFSGTLRENLDPFSKYTDKRVFEALNHAHLTSFYEDLKEGLDYDVGERGDRLSVGERQLVCLARALLKENKILVLDEATAAVDLATDDLIQDTIRTCFRACTVITIAHRISTITDYNRVMVMEKGKVAEFERPELLLQNKQSLFYSLASEAGIV